MTAQLSSVRSRVPDICYPRQLCGDKQHDGHRDECWLGNLPSPGIMMNVGDDASHRVSIIGKTALRFRTFSPTPFAMNGIVNSVGYGCAISSSTGTVQDTLIDTSRHLGSFHFQCVAHQLESGDVGCPLGAGTKGRTFCGTRALARTLCLRSLRKHSSVGMCGNRPTNEKKLQTTQERCWSDAMKCVRVDTECFQFS